MRVSSADELWHQIDREDPDSSSVYAAMGELTVAWGGHATYIVAANLAGAAR